MKKNMIVAIALALGVLSIGAVTASAAGSCCDDGEVKCNDKQVVQQFIQEAASLTSILKSKDIELRELYGYEGIDTHKIDALEAEIKELKGKIQLAGEKHKIPPCCLS